MSKQERKARNGRRDFVKKVVLGAGSLALISRDAEAAGTADRMKVLAALGETIIPSKPGDPGFKELEPQGIAEKVNSVLRPLRDDAFMKFNEASKPFFKGRTFVDLGAEERAQFLNKVIEAKEITDNDVRRVYRFTRITVLKIFYSNFPENKIPRDEDGIPILKTGDGELHQITTPNTTKLATGWDIAGYRGPLTWEMEEQLRAKVEKVHWHDPDDMEALIVRYRPKKSG